MRIITGTARGRKLKTPDGLETRPTSELVKEAVFSIIQFEIEGAAVLDLFAGSGQMGIEALSRGARECTFVDQSKVCRGIIEDNLGNAGLSEKARVLQMDASMYLKNAPGLFDIAFLDPPYQNGVWVKLIPMLAPVMSANGIIICETGIKESLPDEAGHLRKHKLYRYGKTGITVYRAADE